MEQINQFLSITNNDTDNKYIKRDVLLRELSEIFDIDKLKFIRTEAEVAKNDEAASAAAKKQEDHGLLMEAFKAQSSGHAPDAVQQTIEMFNIQLPGSADPSQGLEQPPGEQQQQ
jgi:hypothetical protein